MPSGRLFLRLISKIRQARSDVNLFIEVCFRDPGGHAMRQAAVHRDLQEFLSRHGKALIELPRDHGKSTQVCARLIWELGRDPSLRIKIVCSSEALAAERGRFIRDELSKNALIRLVFPCLKPSRPWNDVRFSIERPANVIGPSVMSIGVQGASTGARADLLVCDDIVDVKAVTSKAERERVKARFRDNLMNLLEPEGRFWGLCTPWHPDDLNAHIKNQAAFAHFRRAVSVDLDPVWPERWPRAALETRRDEIGPIAFARGYRLAPLSDEEIVIKADTVRFWYEPFAPDRLIFAIDPAISTNPHADRSAIVVLGNKGLQTRCLSAVARRVDASGLIDWIDAMDRQWNPHTIVLEGNGAFAGLAELMIKTAGFGPKVQTVVASRSKLDRVSVFSVAVTNGSFQLRGHNQGVDPSQQELLDEMIAFPSGAHDDLLDAAAMGTAYLLDRREPRAFTL